MSLEQCALRLRVANFPASASRHSTEGNFYSYITHISLLIIPVILIWIKIETRSNKKKESENHKKKTFYYSSCFSNSFLLRWMEKNERSTGILNEISHCILQQSSSSFVITSTGICARKEQKKTLMAWVM